MRLQPQHADMVATFLNEESTKPQPATLAAAYTKTVSWVKAAISTHGTIMIQARMHTRQEQNRVTRNLKGNATYVETVGT